MVCTLPGRTQGLGLITEPLIADLRIDRVDYATINLWATLIGAGFALPVGRLTDLYGSRIVLSLLALALGSCVIAMSASSGYWDLAIWITLTRGLGQSALSVVSLALAGKSFGKRLHFAMGIYSVLVAIGFIAAFPLTGGAVLSHGWRFAWKGVGMAVALGLAPLAWFAVGDITAVADTDERTREDFDLAEALRTPAFWIFGLSSSLFGLVYSGIALFNESILVQRGFTAETYHTVLVISTMVGLAANFAGGWAASRWPIQRLTSLGMAVLAASLLMLPFVTAFTHVAIYAAAMGTAGGVVTVVFFSMWRSTFGTTHLGRIQGVAQMMTVVASAIGPLLLAQTLQQTGSYSSIFFLLAACVAALGIAAWLVKMPVRLVA